MIHQHPYFLIPFVSTPELEKDKFLGAEPSYIIDYLKATHRRFEYQIIPRIEQNFLGLLKLYPNNFLVQTVFKLFIQFQLDLMMHIQIEEETIYKAFLDENGTSSHNISHEDEEPYLTHIIALLSKQECCQSTFGRSLMHNLIHFEEELKEHAWLEEHIVMKKLKR